MKTTMMNTEGSKLWCQGSFAILRCFPCSLENRESSPPLMLHLTFLMILNSMSGNLSEHETFMWTSFEKGLLLYCFQSSGGIQREPFHSLINLANNPCHFTQITLPSCFLEKIVFLLETTRWLKCFQEEWLHIRGNQMTFKYFQIIWCHFGMVPNICCHLKQGYRYCVAAMYSSLSAQMWLFQLLLAANVQLFAATSICFAIFVAGTAQFVILITCWSAPGRVLAGRSRSWNETVPSNSSWIRNLFL